MKENETKNVRNNKIYKRPLQKRSLFRACIFTVSLHCNVTIIYGIVPSASQPAGGAAPLRHQCGAVTIFLNDGTKKLSPVVGDSLTNR